MSYWDFPCGTMDKNPPANAGDMDLIPDPGRPHVRRSNSAQAPQLLGLSCRSSEAHEPRAQQQGSSHRETPVQLERRPRCLQPEKAPMLQCRPSAAKNKQSSVYTLKKNLKKNEMSY